NSRPRPWQGRALPTELFPPDVNCISALSREAHYTRNHHGRNTLKAFFCDFYLNADFINKMTKLKTALLRNGY
ncbi:hypothetical protein, partial [Atlantibacter sp.]|uniref:hypothetical protein n=1 Tax=Atlantibacter sp. TaxID=1903473 RepID=UPI0028A861D0